MVSSYRQEYNLSFEVSLCSNINSLKTISVRPHIRTRRALTGLNGHYQPQPGPPGTDPACGLWIPFKLSSGSSVLAWVTSLSAPTSKPGSASCLWAWLSPSPKLQYDSSPVQTSQPGWTSDTCCSLSPNLSGSLCFWVDSPNRPWTSLMTLLCLGLTMDPITSTQLSSCTDAVGLCLGPVRAVSQLWSPLASTLPYLQEQPAFAAPWQSAKSLIPMKFLFFPVYAIYLHLFFSFITLQPKHRT